MGTKKAPKYPHDSPPLYRADKGDWERIRYRLVMHIELRDFLGSVAQFADQFGESIYPGVDMLAVINHTSPKTVKRRLDYFRDELPLLELMKRGGGRPSANRGQVLASEYRLVVPDDLAERVPMLSADYKPPAGVDLTQVRGRLKMTRVSFSNSGHGTQLDDPSFGSGSPKLGSRTTETRVTNDGNSGHGRAANDQHHPLTPPISEHQPSKSVSRLTSARDTDETANESDPCPEHPAQPAGWVDMRHTQPRCSECRRTSKVGGTA